MAQRLGESAIGTWYAAPDGGVFEIVGIDVKAEVVLVQHYDGALDEIDFDLWDEIDVVPCAAPENLTGALDAEAEDFGFVDDHSGRSDNPNSAEWLDAHGY